MVLYHTVYTFSEMFAFPFFMRLFAVLEPYAPPVIATTFILVSAYSSSLSKKNVKRGAVIFAVAMGLTVATCFIMPLVGIEGAGIKFGVLHFLGVAVMLSPLLLRLAKKIPFLLGVPLCAALAVGTRDLTNAGFFGLRFADPIRSVNVLFPFGIYHEPFFSADYYPLLPWIFVFMIGCFLAARFPKGRLPAVCYKKTCPPVEFLGRHALIVYVAHQPVIYGVGMLISLFLK